jgi:hypothetical protein
VKLIRGFEAEVCPFHADVLHKAVVPLVDAGYSEIKCAGGGQMQLDDEKKTLLIAGTSQGFGPADHEAACEACREHLEDYAVRVVDKITPNLVKPKHKSPKRDNTWRVRAHITRFHTARASERSAQLSAAQTRIDPPLDASEPRRRLRSVAVSEPLS